MPLPKYQTAIEIINEVLVPQIDANSQDIKAIAKEVISNVKDFDKKVEEVYNTLEAKEEESDSKMEDCKTEYMKYCEELRSEIENLNTRITSDTSTEDIGKIVDELSAKVEALENEEKFEYDDEELKKAVAKLNVDLSLFKEKILTSKSVIDEINSKTGIIEASSVKGLIETLNNISNQGGNNNVKIAAPILEVLSSGISVMQGATRLNFTNATVTNNNGTIDITTSGGSGSPGGSNTQLQYNNGGAFGGITGATTNGTVVTLTSPILISPNIDGATGTSLNLTGTSSTILNINTDGTTEVLQVDASTASLTDGVKITGGAGGVGPVIESISSGATAALNLKSLGNTFINFQPNGTTRYAVNARGHAFTTGANATAAGARFSFTGSADLTLTASTEAPSVNFDSSQTRQHATGALTLQRDFLIQGSTHSFVGASTLTNDASLAIVYGNGGTNATITNLSGLLIQTRALTGVTNAYGINIVAPTGATTNAAALFTGDIRIASGNALPNTSDGAALGTTALMWSDLFLASGGVINFNNGNATLTHSTGLLTSNVPVATPQIYNADQAATVTANAATITRAFRNNTFTNSSAAAMTITLSTTGASAGDLLIVQIYDFSAVAQTITFVNTENSDQTVPATSNGSTTLPRTVGFKWNPSTSKWRCLMNV